MKKYSLIALVVLAALMVAACSRSKLSPEVDENAWIYDETLPVPIQFDSSEPYSIETKGAPIQSTNFVGTKLFIAGWDRDASTISATTSSTIFPGASVVPAEVITGGWVQFVNGSGEPMKRYYPMGAKSAGTDPVNYNFYGFTYPTTNPTITGTSVSLTVQPQKVGTTDYNQDILWAKSVAKDGGFTIGGRHYEGFNGPYMRAAYDYAQATDGVTFGSMRPNLTFQHLLSLIDIYVCGDGDATGDAHYTYGDNQPIYTVKDLQIMVRYNTATLNILDGTGVTTLNNGSANTDWYTYDAFEDYSSSYGINVMNKNTNVKYGSGIFLIPGPRSESDAPQIRFTLVNNVNSAETIQAANMTPITLTLPTYEGSTRGYAAHNRYTYYIKVKPAGSIEIKVSVADWDTGTFPGGSSGDLGIE